MCIILNPVMKIKTKPEDFIVREVSNIQVKKATGAYRIYRLEKRQWDTLDLIRVISQKLGIRLDAISLGGMKDRYGETEQLLSIKETGKLPEKIEEKNFTLAFLGYADEKISAGSQSGNSFEITLRDITPAERKVFDRNVEIVKSFGIPNYYDEQRFGAARHGKGYMGKEIFLGNMEKALRLFLEPSKHDRKAERSFKQSAIENWCAWEKVLPLAPPKYRKLIEFLSSRGKRRAFADAFGYIDKRFLVLSIFGYQSYLYNRILAGYIRERSVLDNFTVKELRFKYGNLLFHGSLSDSTFSELCSRTLPVPGFDTRIDDPLVQKIVSDAIAEEGIFLDDLKVRTLRHVSVNGIERNVLAVPLDFRIVESGDDDIYPDRQKIRLSFFMQRGSYATLVIKRLFIG
jgi:tRNA pseudouridine13 synthase